MADDLITRARAYLAAIETGDSAALAASFTPDAVQVEHPNRLKPNGDRRDVTQIARDFERGKALLSAQRYEVRHAIASGNTVAMQLKWTGTLAVPLGPLAAGSEMTCDSAVFLTFRDGRISAQENYDSFPG